MDTAYGAEGLFSFAGSPDIIRSNQKDTSYIQELNENISSFARLVLGSRITHGYHDELLCLAGLAYYGLLTLPDKRSLGEEYVDILHVNRTGLGLTSFHSRLGVVLGLTLGPYIIKKSLPSIRRRLRQRLERHRVSSLERVLLSRVDSATSTDMIYAIHLMLFYLSGSYYHISKRLFGLRYLFGHAISTGDKSRNGGYEVLGWLLLIQFGAQAMHSFRAEGNEDTSTSHAKGSSTLFQIVLDEPTTMSFISDETRKCTLCLSTMKDPTAALCGHLFCWVCIEEWCKGKPECPLCRRPVLTQHLLPIR